VGLPAEVILDAAEDKSAGLVVLSTHGRSGLDRWYLGSVADAVVRHGDVPVLVCRTWVSLAPESVPAAQDFPGIPTVIPVPKMQETPVLSGPEASAPEVRQRRTERKRQL
jgi:hypothetical protein